MKKTLITRIITLFAMIGILSISKGSAQTCEWRLGSETYSSLDPDGAGPATGSATFTLQIRATSGTIPNIGVTTTGFSYQSLKTMVPTTPGCAIVTSPANITVSPEFSSAGFLYETVNQCNSVNVNTGTQIFDRTAAGSMISSASTGITLTTTFKDAFTVTLWTLGTSYPQGGYVMINSGSGGAPGGIGSYGIFDNVGGDFITNSLTYTSPLALGGALPVLFTKFGANCSSNGTLLSWATAQEANSRRFDIEKSNDGNSWKTIGTVAAAGNSSVNKNYQQLDLDGGTAFYRIKQIDKDGQYIYTIVERTNCQVKNIKSAIYPVPAKDILNVVIKSDRSIRTQLLIFDMQGKMVKKMDAPIIAGNNNFRVNLSGLVSGDYLIRTNDATIMINKVFTVVK